MGNHNSMTVQLNSTCSHTGVTHQNHNSTCSIANVKTSLKKVLPTLRPGQRLRLTTNGHIMHNGGTLRSFRPLSMSQQFVATDAVSRPMRTPAEEYDKAANDKVDPVSISATKCLKDDSCGVQHTDKKRQTNHHWRKKCKAPQPPSLIDQKLKRTLSSSHPNILENTSKHSSEWDIYVSGQRFEFETRHDGSQTKSLPRKTTPSEDKNTEYRSGNNGLDNIRNPVASDFEYMSIHVEGNSPYADKTRSNQSDEPDSYTLSLKQSRNSQTMHQTIENRLNSHCEIENYKQKSMPNTLESIAVVKAKETLTNTEERNIIQLTLGKEELQSISSKAEFSDITIEEGDSSSISLYLRPMLPKKQPDLPRFSPTAAWKNIDLKYNSLPVDRSKIPYDTLNMKHTSIAYEDSGISTDNQSPSPFQDESINMKQILKAPPLAASSPVIIKPDEADWIPSYDLEVSSGEENCLCCENDGFSTPPKFTARKSLFTVSEDNENYANIPLSYNSLKPKSDSKNRPIKLDDNWVLSHSVPHSLDGLVDDKLDTIQTPNGTTNTFNNHIMYLPEYQSKNQFDYNSLPPQSTKLKKVHNTPNKPPRNSLNKFSYQSTIRIIERRKMEAKLDLLAAEEEANRRKEIEILNKVEEEFERKRSRYKSSVILQRNFISVEDICDRTDGKKSTPRTDSKDIVINNVPACKNKYNKIKDNDQYSCRRAAQTKDSSTELLRPSQKLDENYRMSTLNEEATVHRIKTSDKASEDSASQNTTDSWEHPSLVETNSTSRGQRSWLRSNTVAASMAMERTSVDTDGMDDAKDKASKPVISLPAVYDPEEDLEGRTSAAGSNSQRAGGRLLSGVRSWLLGRRTYALPSESASQLSPDSVGGKKVEQIPRHGKRNSSAQATSKQSNEKRKSIYQKISEFVDTASDISGPSGSGCCDGGSERCDKSGACSDEPFLCQSAATATAATPSGDRYSSASQTTARREQCQRQRQRWCRGSSSNSGTDGTAAAAAAAATAARSHAATTSQPQLYTNTSQWQPTADYSENICRRPFAKLATPHSRNGRHPETVASKAAAAAAAAAVMAQRGGATNITHAAATSRRRHSAATTAAAATSPPIQPAPPHFPLLFRPHPIYGQQQQLAHRHVSNYPGRYMHSCLRRPHQWHSIHSLPTN